MQLHKLEKYVRSLTPAKILPLVPLFWDQPHSFSTPYCPYIIHLLVLYGTSTREFKILFVEITVVAAIGTASSIVGLANIPAIAQNNMTMPGNMPVGDIMTLVG
jgi:hypothetical protein